MILTKVVLRYRLIKSAALELIIYGCWPSSIGFHYTYLDFKFEKQFIGLDIEEIFKATKNTDLIAWLPHRKWMDTTLQLT